MTAAPTAYLPPIMSDIVIDISHWQSPVDFGAAKSGGIHAVILKATQGVNFVDPTFGSRAVAAAAVGLLVGAYHFFDDSDPSAQAGFFLATIARAGVPMLMALDFEPTPTSQYIETRAGVWVSTVRDAIGSWPVLYTGRWDVSPAQPEFQQCPLWLPEFGSNPVCPPGWTRWELHQYTDGHAGPNPQPVPGIGLCDRSVFAGTPTELVSWWTEQSGAR